MAYIGHYDITSGGGVTEATTEYHKILSEAAYDYVAGANEEIFQIHVYGSVAGTVEVGVYDITSGVASAPLLVALQCTMGNAGYKWYTFALTPTALTNGQTYAVAWRAVNSVVLYRTGAGANTGRVSSATGSSALASTFADSAVLQNKYSIAVETRSSATTVPNPLVGKLGYPLRGKI